ncbi:hypothetical protein [Legionella gresilensis]|uniref:hypothetical protein n=1 Tax=Legionella gresilensis TaxID=91823 RepID=UPI0013EF6EAD|nr:hypothetical protein [Legionella gresilensis]
MEINSTDNRVLAYSLATEISKAELEKVAGGSAKVTYQTTDYYTNRHGVSDTDLDMDWD